MDVSDNSQRDLNEIVFETKLESRNIISIFESILFEYDTKWRLFFYIEQNKLTYGTLPYLTKKMERQINITETHIKKESQEHIVKCFAEQRQVLIVVISGDTVLLTDSEMLNILLNKIKRNIADGKQLKRHMDTDIFLATFPFHMNQEKEYNASKYSEIQHPQNKPLAANKNSTKRNDNVSKGAPSKPRPLTPRRPHSTTFIEPDKRDIFDQDISVTTIPNDKYVYKNKSFPPSSRQLSEVDKFPIQVVETDAGMSSFEPYPEQTSTLPSATRESEPGQRGFSNPGDSNTLMRQATVQRSMVTSGSGIPFHLKPSRYADYQDQKKRYDSFQTPKWLTDSKPDINLLVGCGFFFTGNNDLVRCYHCGIGLKDWIKDDDPLAEHVKYSSTCDFLIWRYGKPKVERMKAALTTESSNEGESRPPAPPSYPIRSPRYQTMEARLASFENFPSANNIPHQQLAVAGLFFTGQSDLCRCFTCDGGLKDWSPGDDPIKEHATYFSNCHYINKLKGHEYVQLQQQSRSSNEAAMGAEGGNNTPHQATEASPNIPIERMSLQDSNLDMSQVVQNLGYSEMDFILAKLEIEKKKGRVVITVEEIINTLLDMKDRAKQLKAGATSTQENKTDLKSMVEENKKLTRLMYCMLCVTGEADILFMPCTHHRTCHECAADLTICPVCNCFIEEKIKTFRA